MEVSIAQRDFSKALFLLEKLIPDSKRFRRSLKTFHLYLLKAEVFTKTGQFLESINLLTHLHWQSEQYGRFFQCRVMYLSSLSKLGLIQQQRRKNRETVTSKTLTRLDFNLREDIVVLIKGFLGEMRINHALKGLFLLSKLDKTYKDSDNTGSQLYCKVSRLQSFCLKGIERVWKGENHSVEMLKFIGRIRLICLKMCDSLV